MRPADIMPNQHRVIHGVKGGQPGVLIRGLLFIPYDKLDWTIRQCQALLTEWQRGRTAEKSKRK